MFLGQFLNNLSMNTINGGSLTSSEYANALIILAASFIIAKIADFIFEKVFLKITSHTETDIDDKIVEALKSPIYYIVVLAGVYAALHTLTMGESTFYYLDNLIQTIIVIVASIAALRITNILVDGFGAKFAARTKSTLDDELMPLFKNIAKIIVVFLAIMAILSVWDKNITPLLASAGILGFAVAFAAQSTIANLFGGISVYFDKPFKVGDRVQLDSGELGDVIEIGIRSTRIKTLDETVIIIPNEKIANAKIVNYNQPGSKLKVKFNVGVVYGSDVAKVRKTLLKAAESAPSVLKNPSPSVLFLEHGDFALKFLLITWAENPHKKGKIMDEVNTAIDREFRKAKIEIAFPTQTIYVKK